MGACCSDMSGGMGEYGGMGRNELDEGVNVAELLHSTRRLTSDVQLWISAANLRDKDVFSKSDPMAVMYAKVDGTLQEIGRTEVVLNSLNPSWVRDVKVSYNFEEVQQLTFRVYDVDTKFSTKQPEELSLTDQQFLGEMSCILAEILASPGQTLTRTLVKPGTVDKGVKSMGALTIKAEEMQNSKSVVNLVLRCSNLDNKDILSKSDPFLKISRFREDGSVVPVYITDVKKNNLHPAWKPIKITLQQLCNGDMDRPLLIECLNFNQNGRHDLIGCTQQTLNGLQTDAITVDLKRDSDSNKIGGKLHVESCVITTDHTFLDYIRGGCEVNFMVAVDFTASNGHPSQHDSLHYLDPSGKPNAYEIAIEAAGEVIEHYDHDKKFPAWGFGGRPVGGTVSHCFNLSGDKGHCELDGVNGVLRAYSHALKNVALAGPTLFAPVINMACSLASEYTTQEKQKYFVLLIITDGVIIDLQQTIDSIVRASSYPLSILIVGVGGADFTEMEVLDADKRKLANSDGHLADRDIVQFVPFRSLRSMTNLRKILLAELPGQLLEYMKLRHIVPNNPAS